MKIIKPKKLKKGDTIGIIASSNSVKYVNKNNWNRGIKKLESKGFKLKFGKYINNLYGHVAGTVEERVEDFMDMFLNPEIKADDDAIKYKWFGLDNLPIDLAFDHRNIIDDAMLLD